VNLPDQTPIARRLSKPSLVISAIAGVVIVGLVIALVSVLARDDSTASRAAKSVTQPAPVSATLPADGGSYITPQDIAIAVGDALPCATFDLNIVPEDADSEITCDLGHVAIGIYDNFATRNIGTDRWLIKGKTVPAGRNWTVAADDPTVIAAAKLKIGGKLITKSCLEECTAS
jgi:hypothetical protein